CQCGMMRLLPGYSLVFVLVMLLVGTSPIGAGTGVHAFDLVHPLFKHVHFVGGRALTHDQIDQQRARSQGNNVASPGPALGSATNVQVADGIGLTGLSLDEQPLQAMAPGPSSTSVPLDVNAPAGRRVAPPDPPPLA